MTNKSNITSTNLYGLIGYPLSHSYSKQYFNEKFEREKINAFYEAFPLQTIDELPELIQRYPNLRGLNVTIPYKQKVIKFLHSLSFSTQMIGAVNTIKIKRSNGNVFLHGYNTDAAGFEATLLNVAKNNTHLEALILGTGGSASAVRYVLRKNGIIFRSVSRLGLKSDQMTYPMVTQSAIEKYKIIINTTPLGMFPNLNEAPDIPYQYLTESHILIDLIYNPEETLFLKHGREKGATLINGKQMFLSQATEAWKIWQKK